MIHLSCVPGQDVFSRLEEAKEDKRFPENARLYIAGPGTSHPTVPASVGTQIGSIRVRPRESFAVYIPNK